MCLIFFQQSLLYTVDAMTSAHNLVDSEILCSLFGILPAFGVTPKRISL